MSNTKLGQLSVLMMRRMDKQSCLDLIQALKQQPRLTRVYDMRGYHLAACDADQIAIFRGPQSLCILCFISKPSGFTGAQIIFQPKQFIREFPESWYVEMKDADKFHDAIRSTFRDLCEYLSDALVSEDWVLARSRYTIKADISKLHQTTLDLIKRGRQNSDGIEEIATGPDMLMAKYYRYGMRITHLTHLGMDANQQLGLYFEVTFENQDMSEIDSKYLSDERGLLSILVEYTFNVGWGWFRPISTNLATVSLLDIKSEVDHSDEDPEEVRQDMIYALNLVASHHTIYSVLMDPDLSSDELGRFENGLFWLQHFEINPISLPYEAGIAAIPNPLENWRVVVHN